MGKAIKFPTPAPKTEAPKAVPNNIVYPKRITIDTEKGIRTTGMVTFSDVVNMCLNAIVSNAFKVVELAVSDHVAELEESPVKDSQEIVDKKLEAVRKAVTSHLYDHMNAAFHDALGVFAPDIAAHPGLTEVAILKCEDELIADYLNNIPEAEREAAAREATQLLEQSRRVLLQKIEDGKIREQKANEAFIPLTPEQDAALRVFADEDATEDAIKEAQAYLEAHPCGSKEEPITLFECVAKPEPTQTCPRCGETYPEEWPHPVDCVESLVNEKTDL